MITVAQFAMSAGLNPNEPNLGVSPSARHYALLKSYLLNMHRGRSAVRRMMLLDLRGYLDIGADRLASDVLVVLRLFLSENRASDEAARPRSVAPQVRRTPTPRLYATAANTGIDARW